MDAYYYTALRAESPDSKSSDERSGELEGLLADSIGPEMVADVVEHVSRDLFRGTLSAAAAKGLGDRLTRVLTYSALDDVACGGCPTAELDAQLDLWIFEFAEARESKEADTDFSARVRAAVLESLDRLGAFRNPMYNNA